MIVFGAVVEVQIKSFSCGSSMDCFVVCPGADGCLLRSRRMFVAPNSSLSLRHWCVIWTVKAPGAGATRSRRHAITVIAAVWRFLLL